MTHISLPYNALSGAAGAKTAYQIVSMADGVTIPIAILHDHGAPDPNKIADNFASFMNGGAPLHVIQSRERMYYTLHPGGVLDLHFRLPTRDGGVSVRKASITFLTGTNIDTSAPAFKKFMGSVQKPKRTRKFKPKAQGLKN